MGETELNNHDMETQMRKKKKSRNGSESESRESLKFEKSLRERKRSKIDGYRER